MAGLLVGMVGVASAQSSADSVFVVAKVPVEAEGSTTAAAQSKARNIGRKRAMDILLRRMTAEDDWVYLPKLALGRAAPASNQYDSFGKQAISISNEQLAALEEDIAVFDEKSSRTSYRASITYRFNPDGVRSLLTNARLPYSESQTRKALLLPILQTKSGVYLWESNNPWARAWLVRPLDSELTPMVLPRGDMSDVQTITARQALAYNQNALSVLANRYGVGQVIVAHGYLSEQDGQYRLRVRLIQAYRKGQGAIVGDGGSGSLYDSANGYGRRGVATVDDRIGRVLTEAWYRGQNDDFPALARRAVSSTMAKHAADWKRKTLVDHSSASTVTVSAYFTSLAEWAKIRQTLEANPNVESVKTGALSSEGATITMILLGDIHKLVVALRQEDLVLWQSRNERWNIAPTSLYGAIYERIDNVALRPDRQPTSDGGEFAPVDNPFNQPVDDRPPVEWRGNVPGGLPSMERAGTTPAGTPLPQNEFSPPSERELEAVPTELPPSSGTPQILENGNGEGTILEQPLEPATDLLPSLDDNGESSSEEDDTDSAEDDLGGLY